MNNETIHIMVRNGVILPPLTTEGKTKTNKNGIK